MYNDVYPGAVMNAATPKEIMLIAAAGCLLAVVPGCHPETEQDKVKKVITSVQKAAEEIETALRSRGSSEVPSRLIGEAAMAKLRFALPGWLHLAGYSPGEAVPPAGGDDR